MVTHANVPDRNETQNTIEQLIFASEEIARNLASSRDIWTPIDSHVARLIEALRIQFSAFSAAAKTGQTCEPKVLRTIGRVYELAAIALCELCAEEDPRLAREHAAKASQLTAHISVLLDCDN